MYKISHLLKFIFLLLIILQQGLCISQDILEATYKHKKGEERNKCHRFRESELAEDRVHLKVSPYANKNSFIFNELFVDPVLPPGIWVSNLTSVVKILDHNTGQYIPAMGILIEPNNGFLDINGIIDLEVIITGNYSYDSLVYNGYSPITFNFILFSFVPDLSTGIISSPYYSDISINIDTEEECEDDGNERLAISVNETEIATIFPNPSNGNIILSTRFKEDQLLIINIYNSSGRRIIDKIQKHVIRGNESNLKFNLEDYPNGIYVLLIKWATGYKSLKIIKN